MKNMINVIINSKYFIYIMRGLFGIAIFYGIMNILFDKN